MKRKVFFFGLISALLVMFMFGCDNLNLSSLTGTDTGDLELAIIDAKTAKAGVQINAATAEGQVASGIKYVSQAEMDALDTAITHAETVLGISSVSQGTIDKETTDLKTATGIFSDNIKEGTKDSYTVEELTAAITAAEVTRDGVPVGVQTGFAPGTEYVLQAAVDAFNTAINAAKAVNSTDPAVVGAAAIALAEAVSTFNGQIKYDGTKSSGYTAAELTTLIATANTAKQGVATSANGTDVNTDVLWVTSADLAALNSAITSAGGATDANRDARYTALNTAINTFNGAKKVGTKPASQAGLITFTGIDSQYNGQYASFRSSGSTEPTGGDYLFGGSRSSTGLTGVRISGGSVTIPVQLVDEKTYSAEPYTGSDKNIRIYLMIKGSASFAFEDLWEDDYEKYTIPFVNFTNGSASTGVGDSLSGALTVTGGLSGNFMVYIVTTAITNSNLMTVMETPVAGGWGDGSSAELEWSPGEGNGTYHVIIMSEAGGGSVKYQNNVSFANGSGSVNWGSMTAPNLASLSVGTLTVTGGSLGKEWTILIVNGPLTGTWEDLDAMDAYVAVAPSYANGMIFTFGATGGTFNPNRAYSIIYTDDETLKYQNNVSFRNGNAAINLASLIEFEFDYNEGEDSGGEEQGGNDKPDEGELPPSIIPVTAKTVTITGLSAYNGLGIQAALFATKPNELTEEEPSAFGMGSIQGGRATVSLQDVSFNGSPWNGNGNWYVAFAIGEGEKIEAVYATKTAKSFSDSAPNVTVALGECYEVEMDYDDEPWENGETDGNGKPDEGETGEEVYGALTVSGLSGEFMVYVVKDTITSSNFATVMEGIPVAYGEAGGSPAELKWYSGNGNGTYNIIISSAVGGGSIKFQNGVRFANGSGSVNWGSMTEVNFAALSVGTLTFTGGSLGKEWTVFIAPGPLTGTGEDLGIMGNYVAIAPGTPSGNGWMIFTIGAIGETFNPNGTYSILYMYDEGMKYGNNVSFHNGNATINLASLTDFYALGGGGGWVVPVPVDPPGAGGDYSLSAGNNARSLFRFVR